MTCHATSEVGLGDSGLRAVLVSLSPNALLFFWLIHDAAPGTLKHNPFDMKPNRGAEWYLNGRSAADPLLCNLPSPPDGLI